MAFPVFLVCLTGCGTKVDPEVEKAATTSALQWLELVDKQDYAGSWSHAAEIFKKTVTKGQWEAQIRAVRMPLGKLVSRELMSRNYAVSLPGMPKGEYLVCQYKASFESGKHVAEIVTPALEEDGEWRVSGYYVK